MTYNINNHIHRYAPWASSRGSSVKNNRFTVENGQLILNNSTIRSFINSPDELPANDNFDKKHFSWRNEMIEIYSKFLDKPFTHGIAAKMINIYLKSVIICGGFHTHPKATAVHPPIDSLLLKALAIEDFKGRTKFWRKSNKIAWSNFNEVQYQNVLDEIRLGLNVGALWEIEAYWQGHR